MPFSTGNSSDGSAGILAVAKRRRLGAFQRLTVLRKPLFRVLLMVAALGCSSPVTQENYEKIQNGMTLPEVEAIFGGPGKSYQGMKTWSNGPDKTITVIFDDRGLVVEKSREGL